MFNEKQKDLSGDFEKIYARFCEPGFLSNKGLAKEVGIYVYPYDPADEITVMEFFNSPKMRRNDKFCIKECNLYELLLDVCDEKRITSRIPDMENKKGTTGLIKQLERSGTPEDVVGKMKDRDTEYGDILLITGVGAAYPYLRARPVLEQIQPVFDKIPVVMLYPGEYDGRGLSLFGKLPSDSYYRAFNLL